MANWEEFTAEQRADLGLKMARCREAIALAVWRGISADAGRGGDSALVADPAMWPGVPVSLDGHLARRLSKVRDLTVIVGEKVKIVERYGMQYIPWPVPAALVATGLWSDTEYLHIGWSKVSSLSEVRRAIGEGWLDGAQVAAAAALVAIAPTQAEAEAALVAAVREYQRSDREERGGRGMSARSVLIGAGFHEFRY